MASSSSSSSSSSAMASLRHRLKYLILTEINPLEDEHVSGALRNCIRTLRRFIAEEIEVFLDRVEETEINQSADESMAEGAGSIIRTVRQIIAKVIERFEEIKIKQSLGEALAEEVRSFTDALSQFIPRVIKNVGEIEINRSGNEVLNEEERSLIWAFEILIGIEARKILGIVEETEMDESVDEDFSNEERDFLHTLGQFAVNEIRKFMDA